MNRLLPTLPLAPAFALAVSACGGGLSGSTDHPSVLATIHGTVEGSQSVPVGNDLAVAIVWGRPQKGAVQLTASSVPLNPMFPSSFSLDMTQLPPDAVMFDVADSECSSAPCPNPNPPPTGVRAALGFLVVYEDINHNGQLDLVAPGAPAYVDKVLGGSREYGIVYLEKPLPPNVPGFPPDGTDSSSPQVGYNWLAVHDQDCEPLGDGGSGVCHPSVLWRPIATPITLSMYTYPEDQAAANGFMCTTFPGSAHYELLDCNASPSSCTTEPLSMFRMTLPSIHDPELLCLGLTSFQYDENCTTTSPGVCLDFTTTCTKQVTVSLDGFAAPQDWPCTAHNTF